MPRGEIDEAVDDLRKWFRLFSLDEFVEGDITRQSPIGGGNLAGLNVPNTGSDQQAIVANQRFLEASGLSPLIKRLSSLIVDTQRGSFTSSALINELISISEEFKQAGTINPKVRQIISNFELANVIAPFFEKSITKSSAGIDASLKEVLGTLNSENKGGININPNSPSKDNPTASILLNKSTRISISNKNGNALSIFFNTIPTMEWSRAIPLVNIKFQFQRPAISADNKASTPSMLKFLEGAVQLSPKSTTQGVNQGSPGSSGQTDFDLKLQTAQSLDTEFGLSGDNNPEGIGEAGSELFLMPQTLVNANAGDSEALRAVPIIDKFRPLASLRQFEVDITPAAGAIAYRTAKLSFTLHDRSRLNEISDFIKAGLYNNTEMLIEYGWEHPDKDKGNAYARFINSLRIKEKYQISNYDLQLKTNGEVDIDLSLFTKGAVDLYTSKIADTEDVIQPQEFVQQLQDRISELRKRIFNQEQTLTKEIRGQQILNTAGDHNANIELSPQLRRELRKTLAQLDKNPAESAKELRQALIDLYGTDGTDGAARTLANSISDQINRKMKIIKGKSIKQGGERTDDPFLESEDFGDKKEAYVSLAKLFLIFVVQPLARTRKFDDIQVIFYNLNSKAGNGRGSNLGSFPIEVGNFQKKYKKLATQRRTANLTLQEFMRFIGNGYLEDISNPLYGLRDLYRYEPDRETGKRNIPVRKFRNNPTALNTEIQNRMRSAGIPDGIFQLPQVDMYVECVPAHATREGESSNVFDGLTVLRIHVFDKLASEFESQQDFLAAQRDDAIATLGDFPLGATTNDDQKDEQNKTLNELVQKAVERGLVEPITSKDGNGSNKVYRFKGGARALKSFIAETMPSIYYGVNNTAVLEAGLRTMQDQKLTSINMINAGDKGDLTPNGGATNGVPVRLFPAQMNMRTLGCPIIEFTQKMFCDFQTGTSFDNIYYATKIQHSIEPGRFNSSIEWVPGDAYGQYQNVVEKVNAAIAILSDMDGSDLGQTG